MHGLGQYAYMSSCMPGCLHAVSTEIVAAVRTDQLLCTNCNLRNACMFSGTRLHGRLQAWVIAIVALGWLDSGLIVHTYHQALTSQSVQEAV